MRRMMSYMMMGAGMAVAFKMMEDTRMMKDMNKMMRRRMRMLRNMF